MKLDHRDLRLVINSSPQDAWFQRFKSLGLPVSNQSTREELESLGLSMAVWPLTTALYVSDRDKFLAALIAIHGEEAVLSALLAIEGVS